MQVKNSAFPCSVCGLLYEKYNVTERFSTFRHQWQNGKFYCDGLPFDLELQETAVPFLQDPLSVSEVFWYRIATENELSLLIRSLDSFSYRLKKSVENSRFEDSEDSEWIESQYNIPEWAVDPAWTFFYSSPDEEMLLSDAVVNRLTGLVNILVKDKRLYLIADNSVIKQSFPPKQVP
jgi:hypothetical protein